LERKVTLYTPKVMYHPRLAPPKWGEMVAHVGKQQELLWEKGSDYDRAVLALFTAVTVLPHGTERSLTRKQFKQLRSDFEELSIEEIAEGKRQLLQEIEDFQDETERFRFNSESLQAVKETQLKQLFPTHFGEKNRVFPYPKTVGEIRRFP
jgi:DNA-directed RNA polymerase alpha subunit